MGWGGGGGSGVNKTHEWPSSYTVLTELCGLNFGWLVGWLVGLVGWLGEWVGWRVGGLEGWLVS